MTPSANLETRTVQLRLTTFGWRILGERAAAEDITVERILADACEYLSRLLADGTPPPGPPRFKRVDVAAHEFKILLSPAIWATLEEEAERLDVRLEAVVEHAHIVYQEALDRRGGSPEPNQQA